MVVLSYCSIFFGWGIDAIKSKTWCESRINRTPESQSDCKDNQWFQNGFNKSINQIVITANSFQNAIYNWSGFVNLHVLKKYFFAEKFISQIIKTPLKYSESVKHDINITSSVFWQSKFIVIYTCKITAFLRDENPCKTPQFI